MKSRKYFLLFILSTSNSLVCANEIQLNINNDTTGHAKTFTKQPHFTTYDYFKREFSYMGIPFIVSGLVVKKQNSDFRTLRNRFNPTFHQRYDDYTQYVPLAATWGMKLAGVETVSYTHLRAHEPELDLV